jgi:hypothetical protein
MLRVKTRPSARVGVELDRGGLSPKGLAGFPIEAPEHLLTALPGVLEDPVAGHQRRGVALADLDFPYAFQFLRPNLGRDESLHLGIPRRSPPTGPR